MTIVKKLTSRVSNALGMIISTVVLTVLAAALQNQYWASPLTVLLILALMGNLDNGESSLRFSRWYLVLSIGAACLLLIPNFSLVWTYPLWAGVLIGFLTD